MFNSPAPTAQGIARLLHSAAANRAGGRCVRCHFTHQPDMSASHLRGLTLASGGQVLHFMAIERPPMGLPPSATVRSRDPVAGQAKGSNMRDTCRFNIERTANIATCPLRHMSEG